MGWDYLGIILAVCAILCAIGFYKFVYFLSIGYGFAVAGGGITLLIIAIMNGWTERVLWLALIQTTLFLAYGIRLSAFLLIREIRNMAYRKTLKEATGNEKRMPVFVLVMIWVFVSVLYTAQLSPMLYRYMNGNKDILIPLVGVGISFFGFVLEVIADSQKTAQKKENPDMVATKGLYRIVRCPNYFGEIIFWTGVFISGVTAYKGIGQWLIAIIAYICITFIMFNGAQRLEKRQMARYKDHDEYNNYVDSTPILIPLLPIYHLNKQ
ncbi:MAG: DUF1295 domain-containing protein [Spirochaetia bacterium]|nr:DUF1295 domain-containing protein [Spirochaetia bacterium]